MNKMIDISDYQRGANLEAAYSNDIKGFIFRAGWGNDDPDQDDKVFEDFVSQAERLGAPWGAYLFSYATCDEDIKSEIAHTLRVLEGRKPQLGVWWDIENSDYKERNNHNDFEHADAVKAWADEFITAMQDSGLTAGVYCNLNYAKNIDFSGIEHIWIAGYFDSPDLDKPPCKCDIWQYSSTARVAGFSGNVDINAVYADWINEVLWNPAGYKEQPGKNPAERMYTVIEGDTLWDIAAKKLGDGTRYTEIMQLSGLTDTTIYPGQELTLPGCLEQNSIPEANSASDSYEDQTKDKISVGSIVRVNNDAKTYDGESLASYVYNREHKVKQINGDRAVITYNGTVVAAVRLADLTLV